MSRWLRALVLLPLVGLMPGEAESQPNFPIFLSGGYTDANGDNYEWNWVLYSDNTFDQGPPPLSPNPNACCGAGGWTFDSNLWNQARLWTPNQMYVGHVEAGCVDGPWAYIPFSGAPDGNWSACVFP